MRKFFRHAAAVFGAAALLLLGIVGYYSAVLPDFYYVGDDTPFIVRTALNISSRPIFSRFREASSSEGSIAVNINDPKTTMPGITHRTLMLFGKVPIKDVSTGEVKRPSLVVCGQPFGIKLMTDGVMVVEIEKLDDRSPAAECGICVGDIITSVNGENVTTNKKISEIISGSKGDPCTVEFRHGNDEKTATLRPVYCEGSYKAGMWVRDSSAGIGTMTFYDPESRVFGGLGHPICDSDTRQPLPLSHGTVGEVRITGCNKSVKGDPGQLLGEFTSALPVGNICQNGDCGVFGILDDEKTDLPQGITAELGFRQEVKEGKAEIYATVEGNTPQKYDIVIEKLDISEKAEHNMIIRVTDKDLLNAAGGIVQGMSGSPIIQDGRIVGAVTHVFVDDPTQGYGVFADEMYASALKAAKEYQ